MAFNLFNKKKPVNNEYAYITDLINKPCIQVSQSAPGPAHELTIEEKIPKATPVQVAPQPILAPATPIKAQNTPAYHHTKDTGTIRFHNDFITRLKELKGPGVTFEQYLKDRLSI